MMYEQIHQLLGVTTSQPSAQMAENIAAEVIEFLNTPELTPLQRYARARCLLNAAEQVCREIGAAAEYHCEVNNVGTEGKMFSEDGQNFMRQFCLTYNYAANDDTGDYRSATIKKRVAESEVKVAKALVKQAEERILLNHPNMQPVVERVTIKWCGPNDELAHKVAQNSSL